MKKFYAHDEENKAKNGDTVRHHGNAAAEQAESDGVWSRSSANKFMVQIRSRLDVADNSGARMATMIGVIGKGHALRADRRM